MKEPSSLAATILAICLLAVPLVSAQDQKTGKAKPGNTEEQVKALQATAIEALLKADTSIFQKYFADDIVIIHGTGVAVTKAEDIENLSSGALKYESYDVRERKIRTYENTAVVNDIASAKGLINSKPFSGDFRVTWVWTKLNGNWKCVSRQITKIPPKA
jgi:ketosteroid isomerase-like protein